MENYWIALQSIPATGKKLILDDQAIWLDPIAEFGLDCRIAEPVRADIFVLPQEQGVLFRGVISGTVAMPCDRCAVDTLARLDYKFDNFELYPVDAPPPKNKGRKQVLVESADEDDFADAVDETVIRLAPHGRGIEINPASLAWEEFALALPLKPVCSENCKGLCPVCGCNLNAATCSCTKVSRDPRMAALRGLTIKNK